MEVIFFLWDGEATIFPYDTFRRGQKAIFHWCCRSLHSKYLIYVVTIPQQDSESALARNFEIHHWRCVKLQVLAIQALQCSQITFHFDFSFQCVLIHIYPCSVRFGLQTFEWHDWATYRRKSLPAGIFSCEYFFPSNLLFTPGKDPFHPIYSIKHDIGAKFLSVEDPSPTCQ